MNQHLVGALEAFAISFLAGVGGYYAAKAIDRYMARRTSRKRDQAIDQAKAQLALVEKLASSERATVIFGFGILYVLIGFISIGEFGGHLLAMLYDGDVISPLRAIVWGIVAVLALYFAHFVRGLDQPNETLEKLRAKIAKLSGSPPHDGAA